jgi:phage tail sheath protein FI
VRTFSSNGGFVPPCGHVAGVIARTDALGGVFKPPANAEIQGAIDLDADLDAESLGLLNEAGVNCLRAFPARGIRLWGARTPSAAPEWRYLNVRRLVLTIVRWIDLNMAWAAFEPNEPRLWVRIQRELTTYLTKLLSAGALKGSTPDQAFYVKCDLETNPPEVRELGQVITEIGLAPLSPAEFIIVRIIHRASATEVG